jgi:outer membrane protein assembly factor BamB
VVDRAGAVAVLEAGPDMKVLAVNKLDDGFDASPALVDEELYLRGRKHLYRISDAEAGSTGRPSARSN